MKSINIFFLIHYSYESQQHFKETLHCRKKLDCFVIPPQYCSSFKDNLREADKPPTVHSFDKP